MQGVVTTANNKVLNIDLDKYGELIFWIYSLISIIVKCFYFQYTTKTSSMPVEGDGYLGMIVSSIGILLILASFVFIAFNKKRNTALLIMNLLLITLLLSDTNFFRYYYNALTVSLIYQVNFLAAGSVNSSVMSLFKLSDIIYIIDLPLITAFFIFIRKKSLSDDITFIKRLGMGLLVIAISAGGFLSVYKKADNKSFAYDKNYIIKSMGILYYHIYDVRDFLREELAQSSGLTDDNKTVINTFYEEKKSYELDFDEDSFKNFHAAGVGKNLIMVQMEAMQQFVINRKVNGREITPNLNKLIKESLYFNNIYYQVANGNTSDAEFLTNTSLYPLKEGAVYHRFPQNKYYSMASLFKQKGYNTYASHAFMPTFWNRDEMYKTLGFDRFINQNDFIMDDFAGWDGESALSDISFYRQTLDNIKTDKPFFSFMVSLSSHHPFDYFEDYDFDVGEYQGAYIGNYIKAANYADKSIGTLLDELKKRGLYDNTMLVLYGDHSAVPKYKSEELFNYLGTDDSDLTWTKLQKVPLIIHWPGLEEGRTIDTIGGQIDILPTVANIMNIKADNTLGKDLLNTEKGYAVLRNGSVITKEFVYLNNLREGLNAETGEVLDKESYEDRYRELAKQLEVSDTIIFKDAFREIGPNEEN